MSQTIKQKNPAFGVGVSFVGIILSIILAFSSIIYYEEARSAYKSDVASKGLEVAVENFKSAFDNMCMITYVSMFIALCACAWAVVQLLKLKKTWGKGASTATIMMIATFGIFALSTLISLGSPFGFSFRTEAGEELKAVGASGGEAGTVFALFLFIVAVVLWFIGAMKLYKVYPHYKSIYQSALYLLISVAGIVLALMVQMVLLALLPIVGLAYAAWCWIKAGKGSGNQVAAQETMTSAPAMAEAAEAPKAQPVEPAPAPAPAPAPQPAPAPAPAKVKKSAPAKAAAPVSAESAGQKSRRTLIIVVSVAAVIIIGLLCVLLFKSGDSKEASAETSAAPTQVTSLQPIEEGAYELTGTIAGKQVWGEVYISDYGSVQGAYCYGTGASGDMIRLDGSYDKFSHEMIVGEYYACSQSGEWNLIQEEGNKLTGTMVNAKGNTYPVNLTFAVSE